MIAGYDAQLNGATAADIAAKAAVSTLLSEIQTNQFGAYGGTTYTNALATVNALSTVGGATLGSDLATLNTAYSIYTGYYAHKSALIGYGGHLWSIQHTDIPPFSTAEATATQSFAITEFDTLYCFNGAQGDKLYVSLAQYAAENHTLNASAYTTTTTGTGASAVTSYALTPGAVIDTTTANLAATEAGVTATEFLFDTNSGNLYFHGGTLQVGAFVNIAQIDMNSFTPHPGVTSPGGIDNNDFILVA